MTTCTWWMAACTSTNGGFNPVLTIMAIAYRASAGILRGRNRPGGRGDSAVRPGPATRDRGRANSGRAVCRDRVLRSGGGTGCASCHEIRPSYDKWSLSAHREVSCSACHGDALTFDLAFHWNNLRRAAGHLRGNAGGQIPLRESDLATMVARCQKCHRQESRLAVRGARRHLLADLLDRKKNAEQKLQDDCLRCHGMHFEGGIRDLVTPLDTTGPWRLVKPELANLPAIPCLACHEMHTHGAPLARPDVPAATPGPKQELYRPSLGLFDRREQLHFAVGTLPLRRCAMGPRGEDQSRSAPGAVLPVPRAALRKPGQLG